MMFSKLLGRTIGLRPVNHDYLMLNLVRFENKSITKNFTFTRQYNTKQTQSELIGKRGNGGKYLFKYLVKYPIAVATISAIGLYLYSNYVIKTDIERNDFNVKLYKKLPLRSISRLWGTVNSIDLPVWVRKPCYLAYAWMFNCNLNEMDIEDLRHYKNLSEFFRRKLKPNARVIDTSSSLISPCDGKVLHFGKVDKGYLEQVKGVNYSLRAFLGEQNWKIDPNMGKSGEDSEDAFYQNTLKHKGDTELFHCVIYLAPGDYHRFHSPTEWNIKYRRHFPGELFSVNPSIARWLEGLFSLNERVVYFGEWKYGFFSMTPVGATNVGSIRVYFDPVLETNLKPNELPNAKLEKSFCLSDDPKGIKLLRGDYFGEFNLGSTIVLIFEAPKSFEFKINQNEKVMFGQPLGSI